MKKLLIILIALFAQLVGTAQANHATIRISKDIEMVKLSGNVYMHTSYAEILSYGRIAANGMVYVNNGEAFLFDTPCTDSLTRDILKWVTDSLKCRVVGFIPNHWHIDCMGGLGYLQSCGIPSYANQKTIEIATAKGLPVPNHGFTDSLMLSLGGKAINCYYFGAAHSLDNVVVWLPAERILFPGCMVKELGAQGLGNTADGDVDEWKTTIAKVIGRFKTARVVIPGHGQVGGLDLLRHTQALLEK